MAEMVWCQSCKTVVWAYDHQPPVDLRGICNLLKLPCPKCGEVGNFDGWGANGPDVLVRLAKNSEDVYDWWSAMKHIAKLYRVEWEISPDCAWFHRPNYREHLDKGHDDILGCISYLIRKYPHIVIEEK